MSSHDDNVRDADPVAPVGLEDRVVRDLVARGLLQRRPRRSDLESVAGAVRQRAAKRNDHPSRQREEQNPAYGQLQREAFCLRRAAGRQGRRAGFGWIRK